MGHLPPSTWKETLALLSLTDPFVIREGKSFRLDLSTGINLLPEWNGFHGPEDMLNGVSFDTFCKCMALIRRMGDEGGGDRDMILREFGKFFIRREGKVRNRQFCSVFMHICFYECVCHHPGGAFGD